MSLMAATAIDTQGGRKGLWFDRRDACRLCCSSLSSREMFHTNEARPVCSRISKERTKRKGPILVSAASRSAEREASNSLAARSRSSRERLFSRQSQERDFELCPRDIFLPHCVMHKPNKYNKFSSTKSITKPPLPPVPSESKKLMHCPCSRLDKVHSAASHTLDT